jgi:hypothetical protein
VTHEHEKAVGHIQKSFSPSTSIIE